jgi:hypothetical protein
MTPPGFTTLRDTRLLLQFDRHETDKTDVA